MDSRNIRSTRSQLGCQEETPWERVEVALNLGTLYNSGQPVHRGVVAPILKGLALKIMAFLPKDPTRSGVRGSAVHGNLNDSAEVDLI